MRRSFQWELTVFTALISGSILLAGLGAAWWMMQGQFVRSVDGKMEIPGERLIALLGPQSDLLELVLEYADRTAQHEFHFVVVGNGGEVWSHSPGAGWMREIDHEPFLPSAALLATIPPPPDGNGEVGPRRRPGPPPFGRGAGRGEGRGRAEPPRTRVARPIAPMVFRPYERADGSLWRLGGISNRDVTVIMALNLADFDDEIEQLRLGFAFAVPLALLASMVGGWLVALRATSPLRRVTETAAGLHSRDMGRRIALSGREPSEIFDLITVLNGMMDRLERGFAQARRFTADASHELKTPLALIQAGIETEMVACQEAEGDPTALVGIAEEVRRLKGILEGLLLLSRADAGRLELGNDSVDLSAEFRLLCEDTALLGEAQAIEVFLDAEDGVVVKGDRVLLGRALQNLLSNALKYNHDGGRIRCALVRESGWVKMTIGNTGPGIPSAQVDQIFERFYRLDLARSRQVDGFGLGLNIAREITQAHGGRLELIASEAAEAAEAAETVFSMVLPLEPAIDQA